MILPILLLIVTVLAGCSSSAPLMTEEARCRQTGGMWRAANNYCEQSGSGGGY